MLKLSVIYLFCVCARFSNVKLKYETYKYVCKYVKSKIVINKDRHW